MSSQETLVARQREPENLESPCSIFDSFLTPNHLFYVRNHFETPELHADSWRLSVEGDLSGSLELSLDELCSMPVRRVIATLECAGNSRHYLSRPSKGVKWKLGAVGNAEWTGVPLAAILELAKVAPDVTEIILEGSDYGEISDPPVSPGSIHFSRSLPIEEALQEDVLWRTK